MARCEKKKRKRNRRERSKLIQKLLLDLANLKSRATEFRLITKVIVRDFPVVTVEGILA